MWKQFCKCNFVSVLHQAMKFYAVSVGRKTGVYHTWKECEMQVKSYSGAKYKKFTTMQDAKQFVNAGKVEHKQVILAENLSLKQNDSILVASVQPNLRKRALCENAPSISNKALKHDDNCKSLIIFKLYKVIFP